MELMELFGYFASIIMGISLGLMGGGGSILTVPILVYLFKIDPVHATAYSLFIVGTTSIFGFINYYKKGEVDLRTGALFAVPGFLGVFLTRVYVVPSLPEEIFSISGFILTKNLLIMLTFATLMIDAGEDLGWVQRMMGHGSLQTRYVNRSGSTSLEMKSAGNRIRFR